MWVQVDSLTTQTLSNVAIKFFWPVEIISYVPYKQNITHCIPKHLSMHMTGIKS